MEYFIERCNNDLFDKIEDMGQDFKDKDLHEKLALAIQWRLELLQPYIGVAAVRLSFLTAGLHCNKLT